MPPRRPSASSPPSPGSGRHEPRARQPRPRSGRAHPRRPRRRRRGAGLGPARGGRGDAGLGRGQSGTIGGGALEWEAAAAARAALAAGRPRTDRRPLGPALGQCCGGAVTLVTEIWDADALAALDGPAHLRRVEGTAEAPLALRRMAAAARGSGAVPATTLQAGWLIEPVAAPPARSGSTAPAMSGAPSSMCSRLCPASRSPGSTPRRPLSGPDPRARHPAGRRQSRRCRRPCAARGGSPDPDLFPRARSRDLPPPARARLRKRRADRVG
jgi:hypothetical protein